MLWRYIVINGAVCLLAVYSMLGLYSVESDEMAVGFILGKALPGENGPGVHWNPPWPLGRVVIAKTATNLTLPIGYTLSDQNLGLARDTQLPPDLWMTSGASLVTVRLDVQYTLQSLREFILSHAAPTAFLRASGQRALNRFLLAHDLDAILTTGQAGLRQTIQETLQKKLDQALTGIHIQSINIKLLTPPGKGGVTAAFQAVQDARSARDEQIQKALAQRAQLLSQARTEARLLRNGALAEKNARIQQARGDADRFRVVASAYGRAPFLNQQRLYLDTMGKILSTTTNYILNGANKTPAILTLSR